MNSVAKYFRFDELGTNFRTEIIAGLTTFVSMAYILFVNPTVLGAAEVAVKEYLSFALDECLCINSLLA